jgi:hypothetical protein
MKDPRGLSRCDPETLERWKRDGWAQGPYQYLPQIMDVATRANCLRRLVAVESERLMGHLPNHTAHLLTLGLDPQVAEQRRLSLLGNAWHLAATEVWIRCHFGVRVPD